MDSSGESEVTLFTHPFSIFAERVELALKEKGIPYKRVNVELPNKPKELLELNPLYGKVPVLLHNGNPVVESLVILEYLEDAWPDQVTLMPKDPVARSKVRFWTDYIHKDFLNLGKIASTKEGTPERQAVLANLPQYFQTLNATMTEYSAEGPFFTGDKFGYLDVILGPWVCYSVLVEKLLKFDVGTAEKLPRLFKWVEAMKAHKSVQEAIPGGDELCEFVAGRLRKIAADKLAAEEAKAAEAKGN